MTNLEPRTRRRGNRRRAEPDPHGRGRRAGEPRPRPTPPGPSSARRASSRRARRPKPGTCSWTLGGKGLPVEIEKGVALPRGRDRRYARSCARTAAGGWRRQCPGDLRRPARRWNKRTMTARIARRARRFTSSTTTATGTMQTGVCEGRSIWTSLTSGTMADRRYADRAARRREDGAPLPAGGRMSGLACARAPWARPPGECRIAGERRPADGERASAPPGRPRPRGRGRAGRARRGHRGLRPCFVTCARRFSLPGRAARDLRARRHRRRPSLRPR